MSLRSSACNNSLKCGVKPCGLLRFRLGELFFIPPAEIPSPSNSFRQRRNRGFFSELFGITANLSVFEQSR